MKTIQHNTNLHRQSAVVAGVSLLVMTIAAMFAYGVVHSSLVISDNPVATFNKIQEASGLFNVEIFGWLVIIITDILVSWAFYIYLKPMDGGYSILAAWLRLIYTAILAVAVSNLIQVGVLVSDYDGLVDQSVDTLATQVMISITTFESIWSLGIIIFGLHLLVVGYIVIKKSTVPKIIGILLSIAGASYMLVHLSNGFIPALENITPTLETVLSIPMIVGELGFGIWLLIKGGKTS